MSVGVRTWKAIKIKVIRRYDNYILTKLYKDKNTPLYNTCFNIHDVNTLGIDINTEELQCIKISMKFIY